jgi:hypothetical protein
VREVLEKTAKKEISVAEAERLLRFLAIEELGDLAKIDASREIRKGIPEIILGEGKATGDLVEISLKMLSKNGRVIISRCSKEQVSAITETTPKDCVLCVHEKAKLVILKKRNFVVKKTGGKIGILTAGTSDIPIAEEARVIVEEMGCDALTAYDVGVAGIHDCFNLSRTLS